MWARQEDLPVGVLSTGHGCVEHVNDDEAVSGADTNYSGATLPCQTELKCLVYETRAVLLSDLLYGASPDGACACISMHSQSEA